MKYHLVVDLAKLSKAERDALPASAFVFPSDRRYPIHDKAHAHAALIDSRGTKDEAAVAVDREILDVAFQEVGLRRGLKELRR